MTNNKNIKEFVEEYFDKEYEKKIFLKHIEELSNKMVDKRYYDNINNPFIIANETIFKEFLSK